MSGALVLVLRVLLAVALYLFLFITLWLIWQDLKRAGFQAMRPKVPALRVEVQAGGSEPLFRTFGQSEVLVGRDAACELHLEDEAISARHAKFSFHHGQWWIQDLHSTNGTTLNGVKMTTPTVLTTGDEIQCGGSIVRVSLDNEPMMAGNAKTEELHGR